MYMKTTISLVLKLILLFCFSCGVDTVRLLVIAKISVDVDRGGSLGNWPGPSSWLEVTIKVPEVTIKVPDNRSRAESRRLVRILQDSIVVIYVDDN
jgi:hypothetical protein